MNVLKSASASRQIRRNKGRIIKPIYRTKRNKQSILHTDASASIIQSFQHLITQNENERINKPFDYYASSTETNAFRNKNLLNTVSFDKRTTTINQTNPFIQQKRIIRKCLISTSKASYSSVTPKTTNLRSNVINDKRSLKTPNSTINSITTYKPHIIIAITEGRGTATGEVGIAAIDLNSPHLSLCQLNDTQSYIHSLAKINYINPHEIIIPHTFNKRPTVSELYRLLCVQFPNINLIPVKRKYFSNSFGFKTLQELCAPEYQTVQLQIVHKFYALTAASALLRYVEDIHCVHFAPYSLKIEYLGFENLTLIDVNTATWLELVESLSGILDRRNCLLSVLNFTNTLGGLRMLRANILQPPCDEKVINTRLDCIKELLQNNDNLMPALQRVVKRFTDIDKILCLCVMLPIQDGNKAGEIQLNQILQLKSTVDALPNLIDALQIAKGRWFLNIKKNLEDPKLHEISKQIKKVLQDDACVVRGAGSHFQRCFAVRPKINGLLDIARRSYSEFISDIQNKVNELSETYGLPLRLHSNSTKGFFILLSTGNRNRNFFNIDDLPPIFIEVHRCGNSITMTTEEIMFFNLRAKQSLDEIQNISNLIICELLTNLRSYMGVLYKLCENIAELDMILSLAQISSFGKYTRPTFNNYLDLKNSVHPILECVIPVSPIPNDVFSSDMFNFHIITGPNMGGKTIYIKQIALLQIMAQIGCYVPATTAVFKIVDRIFSRLGFNDDIECCVCTYGVEIGDIHNIIQTLTPKSLIIIDEICRGTACEEGTCVAWAICEYLLNTKAFTFFTTHLIYLTKLQDIYYNVTNLHTEVLKSKINDDANAEKLIYKYKIIPGITNIDHYGLALAKNTNMSKRVINLAEDLINVMSIHKKPLPQNIVVDSSRVLLYKLATDLIQESYKPNSSLEQYDSIITNFKKINLYSMNKTDNNLNNEEENELGKEKKKVEIESEYGEEKKERELEIEEEEIEIELGNEEEVEEKELVNEKEEDEKESGNTSEKGNEKKLENAGEKKEEKSVNKKQEENKKSGLRNKEVEIVYIDKKDIATNEVVKRYKYNEDIGSFVLVRDEQDNTIDSDQTIISISDEDEIIYCKNSTESDNSPIAEPKQNYAHKNDPITAAFFDKSFNTTNNNFFKNDFIRASSHRQPLQLFSNASIKSSDTEINSAFEKMVKNNDFKTPNKKSTENKHDHGNCCPSAFCPISFKPHSCASSGSPSLSDIYSYKRKYK